MSTIIVLRKNQTRHTLKKALLNPPPLEFFRKFILFGTAIRPLESFGVLVQTEANLEANHREVVGALLYEVTSM